MLNPYLSQQKAPKQQNGTVSVTSHRLFYIDGPHPRSQSFAIDLGCVTRTDYYAGLFTSSPKVTVYLSASTKGGSGAGDEGREEGGTSWECQICAFKNPPGLSPAAARVCGLCGVPREAVEAESSTRLSSSLPSTSALSGGRSKSLSTTPEESSPAEESDSIPCPACTFLNHRSLRQCEICDTELPKTRSRAGMKSAPVSRPHSPDDDEGVEKLIKVSFRKGGDKPMYELLKRSLRSKAWEVRV